MPQAVCSAIYAPVNRLVSGSMGTGMASVSWRPPSYTARSLDSRATVPATSPKRRRASTTAGASSNAKVWCPNGLPRPPRSIRGLQSMTHTLPTAWAEPCVPVSIIDGLLNAL
jgi:hypothetical protein